MNGNKIAYTLNNVEKELIMDTILKQLVSTPENVSITELLSDFRTRFIIEFPTNTIEDEMGSSNPDKDNIKKILGFEYALHYFNKLNC